jgi:MoaD family protein
MVKIQFISPLQSMVGKTETLVNLPDGTDALQAIKTAMKDDQKAYENIFNNDDTLKQYIIVMKNGINISMSKNLTEPLQNGDLIQLLPTVSGGQPSQQ